MTNKKTARILIIDDDALVSRSIYGLLQLHGYLVDVVANGAEGIEKANRTAYDLIISDVRMPGLDGIRTVERIQQELQKRGTKSNFIFITGFAEEDAPQHAIRLGITEFLLKPFDTDQFLQAVERNLKAERAVSHREEVLPAEETKERWRYPENQFVYEKLVTLRDTNMEGNVYFSNYFAWQGEVREALLLSHPHFAEEFKRHHHIKMITHSAYQRFAQECYMGDVVQVKMTSREIKKCSFILVFRFFNKRTQAFLAEGWQRIAHSDVRSGKICTIPPYLLDLIEPISEEVTKAYPVGV